MASLSEKVEKLSPKFECSQSAVSLLLLYALSRIFLPLNKDDAPIENVNELAQLLASNLLNSEDPGEWMSQFAACDNQGRITALLKWLQGKKERRITVLLLLSTSTFSYYYKKQYTSTSSKKHYAFDKVSSHSLHTCR